MENEKKPGKKPDFKSKFGGWCAWKGVDKNIKEYLHVTIEGLGSQTLFKNEGDKE